MKVSQSWIVLGYLTLLCVLNTGVGAKPFKTRTPQDREGGRRTRVGPRRMRVLLQRYLQTASPQVKQNDRLLMPNISKRERDNEPYVRDISMPLINTDLEQTFPEIGEFDKLPSSNTVLLF